MNNILEKLGLTENESKVYLGFNSNPNVSAAQLSRLLKMDKSSAYKATESLLEKGLVARNGWGKGFLYKSTDPESLFDLYRMKEIELHNSKDMLTEFIKNLKRDKPETRVTNITIERGLDALMAKIIDSVENNKEKIIREKFHHHDIFNNQIYVDFVLRSAKDRSKRKVFIKQLESKKDVMDRKGMFPGLMTDLVKYYKEVRVLPDTYNDPNSLRIWDNTAMILSYDEQGEFIILTIKDKYIVTLLKSFYDFLWESSSPVIQD